MELGAMSLPKLADLKKGEYNLDKSVREEIIFLKARLERTKAALLKVSEAPFRRPPDIQRKQWAKEARELSYDIEDTVDTLMVRVDHGTRPPGTQYSFLQGFIDRCTNLLRVVEAKRKLYVDMEDNRSRVREVHERNRRHAMVHIPISAMYKDVTELVGIKENIENLVQMIMDEVEETSKEATTEADPLTLVLSSWLTAMRAPPRVGSTHSDSTAGEPTSGESHPATTGGALLARGLETSKHQPSKHWLKIVSIVGIGGLGKTTLANAVYQQLKGQFDCSAFVSVSLKPSLTKVLKNMFRQLSQSDSRWKYINIYEAPWDRPRLTKELRKFLRDKKYFIVIDDIWHIRCWKIIRHALVNAKVGSKIITTTRILNIAEQVAHVTYKMEPLSLNNSRELLNRRIFGSNENKDNNEDTELTVLSDRILKKCGGVPLAIITMACMLARIPRNEWYEVYRSVGARLASSQDAEGLRQTLLFTYYNMPTHLRACLLYLSMFPEDYEIDKDCLIWMWIAEGFIGQSEKKGMNLFQLGESYFNELMNVSIIHPAYRWNNAMIRYFRVHDMYLDLIRSLASEENFVSILDGGHHTSVSERVRRLSLQNRNENYATPVDATMNMEHVRSIAEISSSVSKMPPLSSFKVVRVLDLENSSLSKGYSLKGIGNLLHLRYLKLRGTGIAEIPEEIGELRFLQTLDITGNEIHSLPSTVILLKGLMCLCIDGWTRVPKGIGRLTNLEELSTFCIHGSEDITEELGCLTELRVLGIDFRNGWNFSTLNKYQLECLKRLQKIESLSISVFGECNLDAWGTLPHLRRLEISGCWSASTLSAWMKQPLLLRDLSSVSIEMGILCQDDLEILGMLPSLSFLDLEVCHEHLEIPGRFVVGAGSFPSLLHCVLRGSIGPVEFQRGAMPMLRNLFLTFPVHETKEMDDCKYNGFDLGLGNLRSLRDVTISFLYGGDSDGDAVKAEAALKHAIAVHPNRPSLQIR